MVVQFSRQSRDKRRSAIATFINTTLSPSYWSIELTESRRYSSVTKRERARNQTAARKMVNGWVK